MDWWRKEERELEKPEALEVEKFKRKEERKVELGNGINERGKKPRTEVDGEKGREEKKVEQEVRRKERR